MEKIHVSIVYIFFYLCFRPKLDVKRGKKKGKKYIFLSSIDSNFINFFRQFFQLLRVGREIEVESIRIGRDFTPRNIPRKLSPCYKRRRS